jgi:hypothetical protein
VAAGLACDIEVSQGAARNRVNYRLASGSPGRKRDRDQRGFRLAGRLARPAEIGTDMGGQKIVQLIDKNRNKRYTSTMSRIGRAPRRRLARRKEGKGLRRLAQCLRRGREFLI